MPEPERCPSCGAAARSGQPWCTQCWADLRAPAAAPAPPPAPPAVAAPPVPGPRAEDGRGGPPARRGWPCAACGELNDFSLQECGVCGTPFLVAGESRATLVLPVVGDVLALGRAQRLLLAAGVALVASLLLVLVVVVAGAVV